MLVTHVQGAAEDVDMTGSVGGTPPGLLDDTAIVRTPRVLPAIQADTARLGFSMASEPKTGALLAVLCTEGVQIEGEVQESEFGTFGWIVDPDGRRLELWQPPAGQ